MQRHYFADKGPYSQSYGVSMGFPGGSDGKEFAYNAGDLGSIPGLGRSSREGNGYPLQYSCLENPTDRGACQATVHVVAESNMTERLTLSLSFSFLCGPSLTSIHDYWENHSFD